MSYSLDLRMKALSAYESGTETQQEIVDAYYRDVDHQIL